MLTATVLFWALWFDYPRRRTREGEIGGDLRFAFACGCFAVALIILMSLA
jgi:hypothetical protein